MKRQAERQIAREDGDDPHAVDAGSDQAEEGNATPSATAGRRPIRGLPKKRLAGGTPGSSPSPSPFAFSAASSPAPAQSNPFAAFTGFGNASPASGATGAGAQNPFASTSLSSASSSPAQLPSGGTGPSSTFGTAATVPAQAAGHSVQNPSLSTPISNHQTPGKTSAADDEAAEYDYYRSLRGLNVSLRTMLMQALELSSDPFADLGAVLRSVADRYDGHRKAIESRRNAASPKSGKNFASDEVAGGARGPSSSSASDTKPSTTKQPAPSAPPSTSSISGQSNTKDAQASPAFSMPAPPAGGFSFANKPVKIGTEPSSTASATLPGVPTVPAGGFSFAGSKFNPPSTSAPSFLSGSAGSSANQPATSPATPEPISSSTDRPAFPSTSSASPAPQKLPSSFGFGAAAGMSKPSSNPTTPPGAAAFRFSFGSSSPPKPDAATSAFATRTIGTAFANTSGVQQPGAFNFGTGKISFETGESKNGEEGGDKKT